MMQNTEEDLDVFFMYDCDLKRPGCVLLQAAYEGTPSLAHMFPTESWLLAPTPGLKKYRIATRDQLNKLIELTNLSMNRR